MKSPLDRNLFALFIGTISFFIVFGFNIERNLFLTSLLRGIIAFAIFFTISTIAHFLIFFIEQDNGEQMLNKKDEKIEDLKHNVNVRTIDEDDIDMNEIYQTSKSDNQFKPLNFKRLKVKDDEK